MDKTTSSVIVPLVLITVFTTLNACTPPESPAPTAPIEQTSPDESTDAAGEIVTLYVGPEQVDCVGVAPQTCLLVRESTEVDYSYFYDNIEGFEYEPGYNYELRVNKTPVENPPADGSSIRWTLIEVVGKEPANPQSLK